MSRLDAILGRLPWWPWSRGPRRQASDARERENADDAERRGVGGAPGTSVRDAVKRVLFYASALVAALVCAALLFNYIIMPVVVRRGDLVLAPDLVGSSLVEAERRASGVGLRVRVDSERPDPHVQVGAVAFQTPSAGTQIKRGRSLAVVVSTGADMRRVPRLSGLNARQAQLDAEHAGFAVEDVVEVHCSRVERGRVIGTDPGEGAVRPLGSGVRLLVSLGPKPAELIMPSLVGKTAEEARLIAEGLGLVLRSVKYERGRSRTAREVVVVQDPVAGARIVEGEGVTLRIGN